MTLSFASLRQVVRMSQQIQQENSILGSVSYSKKIHKHIKVHEVALCLISIFEEEETTNLFLLRFTNGYYKHCF